MRTFNDDLPCLQGEEAAIAAFGIALEESSKAILERFGSEEEDLVFILNEYRNIMIRAATLIDNKNTELDKY